MVDEYRRIVMTGALVFVSSPKRRVVVGLLCALVFTPSTRGFVHRKLVDDCGRGAPGLDEEGRVCQ